MKLFKKSMILFASVAALMGVGSTCRAEIIPAYGPGQIGLTSVVLCDSLTLRSEGSSSSDSLKTLHAGDRVIVMNQKDGWAEVVLGDSEDSEHGFVNASYLAIDPAWYRTEDTTTVYAWNDTGANKVAQLGGGTTLPILKNDGSWVVVGLRGASGWIRKTDADLAGTSSTSAKTQNTAAANTAASSTESRKSSGESDDSFTVYAEDGSAVTIHPAGGSMFEDARGRTYSNIRGDMYYCITTDTTYAADPKVWTEGEPTPDDEDEDGYEDEDYDYTDDYDITDEDEDDYDYGYDYTGGEDEEIEDEEM